MQQQQQRFGFLASIAEIVGGRGKGCGATGLHVYARKLHGGGGVCVLKDSCSVDEKSPRSTFLEFKY